MNNEEKNLNQDTEELENKDSSKKVLLGIFGTMILVVAVIGVSFAMFYFSMKFHCMLFFLDKRNTMCLLRSQRFRFMVGS